MNIKEFFADLGKGIANVAKYIIKRIPDAQIDIALAIVKSAAGRYIDNTQRREWAVGELQKEAKIPESIARWLVETAVLQLKAETEAQIDELGEKVKKLND